MKKQLYIMLLLVGISSITYAQHEYRLSKSTGTLKINLNNVIIEGYEGKDIIFDGEKVAVEETDERAKGLLPISASGYIDNTGLGINVTQNALEVLVKSSPKRKAGLIKIKVPQTLKISILEGTNRIYFTNNNRVDLGEIVLKNLKNEIEVSVYASKIKVENSTGPMNIKTISGPIEAIFDGEIKGPVSLISVSDYVDITLPSTTKANIEMASNTGKIYAAKEFNIDFEKTTASSFAPLNAVGFSSIGTKDRTVNVNGQVSASGGKITGSQATASQNKNTNADITVMDYNQVKIDSIRINGLGSTRVITGGNNHSNLTYTYSTDGVYFGGGEKVKGKLNGGSSIDLVFKSNNKNVYLRQK